MKFMVKRTCVNIFLQTRKKVFKHVCKQSFKHTCIQTYLHTGNQEKRYKKKSFSNIQAYKHSNSFCVRERQKRSKKYHARTRFVENNYSCNQTFKLACFGDSK